MYDIVCFLVFLERFYHNIYILVLFNIDYEELIPLEQMWKMQVEKLTHEVEDYTHIKFGFSIKTIQNLWTMSADANEFYKNCDAAKSLSKTLNEVHAK